MQISRRLWFLSMIEAPYKNGMELSGHLEGVQQHLLDGLRGKR